LGAQLAGHNDPEAAGHAEHHPVALGIFGMLIIFLKFLNFFLNPCLLSVGAEPYVRTSYIALGFYLSIHSSVILSLHWLQHLSAKWGCLHEAS